MASFDEAFDKTITVEGGYNNNPNDRGNYNSLHQLVGTKWGIAAKTYEDAYHRVPTIADMRNLTQEQAKEIYRRLYWQPIKGDQIKSQSVAEIIFDHALNRYPDKAVAIVSATLTFLGRPFNGTVMDAQKVAAINSTDPETFFKTFKAARVAWYKKHSNPKFLTGLLTRINKFIYNS